MASKKKPCRYFQLGICRKSSKDCDFAHDVDPDFKPKLCAYFAKGKCGRGDDCQFSHAQEDIDFVKAANRTPDVTASAAKNTEAQSRAWRYKIPEKGTSPPLGLQMSLFCQQAFELVGGEVGLMQEVIELLASEGGLKRVTEITDQGFERFSNAQLARIFDKQILPFFTTITHKNVVASVILGPRLMTIYNIIYNGDDAAEDSVVNTATVDAVENSLAAFFKLIEVNTGAQVHDGLKHIAETFATLSGEQVSDEVAFAIRPAQKYLHRIEQRLGLGQALPTNDRKSKVPGYRATFELARERPGELSEDGARHDNDHVDVRNISILPTLQEIQSSRSEYLPLADPREWHLGGLEGLLDRHFRLLRENTVGQLRDAAKFELERLQNPQPPATNGGQTKRQGARTYVYENVVVSDVGFDVYSGLELVLSFDQPKTFANKSKGSRREWWESSKRMEPDALICLLNSEGSATFFVVSREPTKPKMKDGRKQTPTTTLFERYDLWSEVDRAHVVVKPVTQADVHPLLDQMLVGVDAQWSLVEFPGVLLPKLMPTLKVMQEMTESLDVPFADILAPVSTPTNPERAVDIRPPTYATRPGFQYQLSSITNDHEDLKLTPGEDVDKMAEELAKNSTLDAGQAEAVVSSLSRSLALIQGPPGTGKSYTGVQLIKVLLDNAEAGDLGPIICVCYTNHALDQGLERLVDEGVTNIVRIGGNSKSERLADVNLRNVVQRLDLTKTEKADRWQLLKKVQTESGEIGRILGRMSRLGEQEAVSEYLSTHYPEHHQQLFAGDDEDGWTTVDYHKRTVLDGWLKSGVRDRRAPRTIEELAEERLSRMTHAERTLLHNFWLDDMRAELQDMLKIALQTYNDLKQKLDNIRTELDLRVLRQANIIGITTSGLARNLPLLRKINAKVLVCEEAGEVLESHLLTALLPSVEHAILIGDHQQLRPHVEHHLSVESKTGVQYALDVSLFERLVDPTDILAQKLPHSTLNIQRRMHPSISRLIRETLYTELQDAPPVSLYPEVVGMLRRLFWMHHEVKEYEAGEAIATSHTNEYEVAMTAALVKHLVRQGVYKSHEIAVLTPYLGQLRKIRKKLASSFEIVLNERDEETLKAEGGDESDQDENAKTIKVPQARAYVARGTLLQALRVATVDNFQGEEAKVVVVSLVRSNVKNTPGFLKTTNRINVLLSRAQHGMYILGNANTTEHVPMWAQVLEIFRESGNFGDALQLCCPKHEETPLEVRTPEDFNCAKGDIKARQVEFLEFKAYKKINLDEEPCIVTLCGHIFTLSSKDGIMDIAKHYEFDAATGRNRRPEDVFRAFLIRRAEECPTCRSSLRNIARYGRIVRRDLLDESAKLLTVWSNGTHQDLGDKLNAEQDRLLASLEMALKPAQSIAIEGPIKNQLKSIKQLKTSSRYAKIFGIRNAIQDFAKKLASDEQSYQRVRPASPGLGGDPARRENAELGLRRSSSAATALLICCDIVILSDVVKMAEGSPEDARKMSLLLDLEARRTRCEELIRDAEKTQNVRQQVEGKAFWARFAAMECGTVDITDEEAAPGALHRIDILKEKASGLLDSAENTCNIFAGDTPDLTEGLSEEIADVRRMLSDGSSSSEMRLVAIAMATEFRGTGHWYRCSNGHPFTIGECGMPMQLARCPACGAGIGGLNHALTDGVERAEDLDGLVGRLSPD